MPSIIDRRARGSAHARPGRRGRSVGRHEADDRPTRERARREVRRSRAPADPAGPQAGRRFLARRGRRRGGLRGVRPHVHRGRLGRPQRALQAHGVSPRVARRPHGRDQPRLPVAVRSGPGPDLPFDEILAGYDPSAHVIDDFFENRLAFAVLLNFPLTTLEAAARARARTGRAASGRRRASAERFSKRIPAERQPRDHGRPAAEADRYIAGYNIWMHHVVDAKGTRLFPPKMRLLTHWNLRDEIKANYSRRRTAASPSSGRSRR